MVLKLELVFVLAMASVGFGQLLQMRRDICHSYPADEPFSICGFGFYDLYGCICTTSKNKYYQVFNENSQRGEEMRRYLHLSCPNRRNTASARGFHRIFKLPTSEFVNFCLQYYQRQSNFQELSSKCCTNACTKNEILAKC